MTSEEALCRLADNPSNSQGLESLYTHNRTVIDGAIQKWFGRNPVVPHATRYVLNRIAARTNVFAPEHQTPEAFVAELADEESRGIPNLACEQGGLTLASCRCGSAKAIGTAASVVGEWIGVRTAA